MADITGYRELTQEEKDLINKIKAQFIEVGKLIDELDSFNGVDKRWLAIGRTDAQTSSMALVRSIAKPETF